MARADNFMMAACFGLWIQQRRVGELNGTGEQQAYIPADPHDQEVTEFRG